jgi:hypothetical protein
MTVNHALDLQTIPSLAGKPQKRGENVKMKTAGPARYIIPYPGELSSSKSLRSWFSPYL